MTWMNEIIIINWDSKQWSREIDAVRYQLTIKAAESLKTDSVTR